MEEIDFSSISFLNTDDEEFVGYWDSKPYTIKSGEVKYYPEFLALHFAKHLSDRMLQKEGSSLSDKARREVLIKQMLLEPVVQKPLTKVAPVAKSKVEKVEEKAFAELEAQPAKKSK